MPENHALDPAVLWTELVVTDADWDAAAKMTDADDYWDRHLPEPLARN